MRVVGKVALVTGGIGGIGAACAALLAQEGATVYVSDISAQETTNSDVITVPHDVTKAADWDRIVSRIVTDRGHLDVLVNCAGIEGSHQRGLATTEEDWNRVLAVNLTGTFLACKAVFPQMLEQGQGSVILTSSVVSGMATAGALAYGASKAGVAHLAKSFATIGAQSGARVRCNSVHPGSIVSRMSDSMFTAIAATNQVSFEEIEDRVKAAIPFGARGVPQDIANLVLYLASDESSYATGSEFKVDGGWSLKSAG